MDFSAFAGYNRPMNNLFIEGPIQTGKSTLIRKTLREFFGPSHAGVYGFTSQRLTDADGNLLGFRLAPAGAALSVTADPDACDNVFKAFTAGGSRVDMTVFETTGIRYMDEAFAAAKAGQAKIILLDEIGGHELSSKAFRQKLYQLLDSEYPCVGVVKSPANTRRMDDSLLALNEELHRHLTVVTDFAEAFRRIQISDRRSFQPENE